MIQNTRQKNLFDSTPGFSPEIPDSKEIPDNSLYTFDKNQIKKIQKKRNEVPIINSPMILCTESPDKFKLNSQLEETSSIHESNEQSSNEKRNNNEILKITKINTPPIMTGKNKPNLSESSKGNKEQQSENENNVSIIPKLQSINASSLESSYEQFPESEEMLNAITDPVRRKENRRMSQEFLKAIYFIDHSHEEMNKILEEYNLSDSVLISQNSKNNLKDDTYVEEICIDVEGCNTEEKFDFDNDVPNEEEQTEQMKMICYLSVPRVVYMKKQLCLMFITPKDNDFIFTFQNVSSMQKVFTVLLSSVKGCFRKTNNTFSLHFIQSNFAKGSIDITTKFEEECEKYVLAINISKQTEAIINKFN